VNLNRFVICGPPNSGKTTYVQQHAALGDLVWDFDTVADALIVHEHSLRHETLPEPYVELLRLLLSALQQYVSWSKQMPGRVFIIVTNRSHAERVAGTIDAQLIELGA
jgi:predicted ATPase